MKMIKFCALISKWINNKERNNRVSLNLKLSSWAWPRSLVWEGHSSKLTHLKQINRAWIKISSQSATSRSLMNCWKSWMLRSAKALWLALTEMVVWSCMPKRQKKKK
jgi:hypothetical protein